jgi:hypothetical protein
MLRAGQTPHGARPNREEVPASAGRVPARRASLPPARVFGLRWCALKPPGRSLEPRSDVWPRGMAVPPEGGQNSAYRSGCLLFNNLRVVSLKSCQNLADSLSSSRGQLAGMGRLAGLEKASNPPSLSSIIRRTRSRSSLTNSA